MWKKIAFLLFCVLMTANLACQSAETPNANANANVFKTVDPANLPPGFSTTPLPANGTPTPGIPDPANVNITSRPGATPTPGIPDQKSLGKPLPKGETPTPGIPDPETLKKQSNKPAANSKASGARTEGETVQNSNN